MTSKQLKVNRRLTVYNDSVTKCVKMSVLPPLKLLVKKKKKKKKIYIEFTPLQNWFFDANWACRAIFTKNLRFSEKFSGLARNLAQNELFGPRRPGERPISAAFFQML